MKKYLILFILIGASRLGLFAQTPSGGFISPALEISELDKSIVLGGGIGAGFILHNWHVQAYIIRTSKVLRPGEKAGDMYNINLVTGGLSGAYQHPIAENLAISLELRAAGGTLLREWVVSSDQKSKDKTNLWLLTPGTGLELSVTKRFHISYSVGFRWVGQIEAMPGVSRKDVNSLTNALTIKIGWLGTFKAPH